jgi:hypothetical protein
MMACGHCRRPPTGAVAALTLLVMALAPAAASAAPPAIGASFASAVGADSAKLSAQIDPKGSFTTYHFEYITEAAYQAGGESFTGASRAPEKNEASLGLSPLTVSQTLFSLQANTTYRYRVVAKNSDPSPSVGPTRTLTTKGPAPLLPDGRGWEMVSPVDKNGGQVDPPGTIADGGVLQAAAQGGAITYGSLASFAGGLGGPLGNQYLATRSSSGWSTENITAPIAYQSIDGGVPYQLFSADLFRGLLFNGEHCAAGGCAVGNLPLEGAGAPVGYQDYYLRNDSSGAYEALLGAGDLTETAIGPASFDLRLAGASPDLSHIVLSSCAALSAGATEVHQGEGCDPNQQNLYEWSAGQGLSLLNGGAPGARLAAQSGAISSDGSRVYFTREAKLFLRDGATTKQADQDAGGGGAFQAASADGSIAFFTKGEHLWRYVASSDSATDLTPAGGVEGVLGASEQGEVVYYQDASGLKRWASGATTSVAANQVSPLEPAAAEGTYPPSTGQARVSPDGSELLFGSAASLTGYDNTDLASGEPDQEIFLYDAAGPSLTCVSCNPTNARPIGPSQIPGAIQNGSAEGSTDSYKPRVLSANSRRVFFESADSLVLTDTNSTHTDVYQWEAQGEGSCARVGGCTALISSGRSAGGASFIDASAEGADAFFITDDSLVGADPGALDLYDARVGGGFAEPSPPLPCEGDACQVLPPEPTDPTLTTLLSGRGNPPVSYHRYKGKKAKGTGQKKKGHAKGKKHKRGRGR